MNTTNLRKLPKDDKDKIIKGLANALEMHAEISFAYLHGSFVQEGGFRDMDMALYLKEAPESPLQYELQMETELIAVVGKYSVDARVLNLSPLSFRYHVIKEGLALTSN